MQLGSSTLLHDKGMKRFYILPKNNILYLYSIYINLSFNTNGSIPQNMNKISFFTLSISLHWWLVVALVTGGLGLEGTILFTGYKHTHIVLLIGKIESASK